MAERPNITMYTSPALSEVVIEANVSEKATRLRTVKRRIGGDFEASFHIPLDEMNGRSEGYLRDFFANRMHSQVKFHFGGRPVWFGVVYDMELTLKGVKRRKSMDGVYNKITPLYGEDGTPGTTQEDTHSQAIYGIRELFIELPEIDNLTDADDEAAALLNESREPFSEIVAFSSRLKPGLDVDCSGFVELLNNLYISEGDGTDTTAGVGEYIKAIIDNSSDNEFVTSGYIAQDNDRNITQKTQGQWLIRKRVWETLQLLSDQPNLSKDPYDFYVDSYGKAVYRATNPNPIYQWGESGLSYLGGAASPWSIRPGVLRDVTTRGVAANPSSFLSNKNDVLIEEIVMTDAQDEPQLKPGNYDDDDAEGAIENYKRWLERE